MINVGRKETLKSRFLGQGTNPQILFRISRQYVVFIDFNAVGRAPLRMRGIIKVTGRSDSLVKVIGQS